eukprot:scaffold5965_cov109-Ochromonas_danica.AAC.4
MSLHLTPSHLRKLGRGDNIQLSHEQLSNALNGEPNVGFEMLKKHCTEMHRAHRQGKGYRVMHKKIHGGKITLKSIGRTLKHTAKKVMSNPVVKKVAKELGHIAVGVANNYAAQNGGVATNLITGALMGAGKRKPAKKGCGAAKKFVKGSPEAKQHMARLRAMRSGGALMPAGGAIKKRPLKFN